MTPTPLISLLYVLLWTSLGLLLYTYLLYPLCIGCLAGINWLIRPRIRYSPMEMPAVAVVIPAYNEEACLAEKIRNTLALAYPKDKLHIYVVTDGSTDRSFQIASSFQEVTVLHEPERKGKAAAINRAMERITAPFTLFTDANCLLNPAALQEMLPYYQHDRTGGIAGEKLIRQTPFAGAITQGEGWYWKFESAIKFCDARVHSVMGAAGEVFSLRTALFEPLPEDTLLDDLVQSMKLCEKGYVIAYARRAVATEAASPTFRDEWKRKVRIATGGFQAMARLRVLSYIYRFPLTAFQFLSHRALRWAICPAAIVLFFLSSSLLYSMEKKEWLYGLILAQAIFYALAVTGWAMAKKGYAVFLFHLPFYFLFMHAAAFTGLLSYLAGNASVKWDKASRENSTIKN